ncbi:camp-binding domain-like protein, partial [Rhizoclosmatium globosum]
MTTTPPALGHIPSLAGKILENEETIFRLKNNVETQKSMIEFLRTQYENMKRRLIEVMDSNEEIRDILMAYVNITRRLKKREGLTDMERELLKSFDQVHFVVKSSRGLDRTKKLLNADVTGSGRIIIDKNVHRLITQPSENSMIEIPAIGNNGKAVQDVTVIKKRDSSGQMDRTYAEEYPHIDVLRKFPLFSRFPQTILETISSTSHEITRKAGQKIISKGEEGREIFFLMEGRVSVLLDESDEEKAVTLQPTTFFGELGVLFEIKRTATVIAKTDCMLLVVLKHKLDEAVNQNAEIKQLVLQFATDKEAWWQMQEYMKNHGQFGGEFVQDIMRKDLKKLPIFSSAPDSFIQKLAHRTKTVVVKETQLVVSIGEESDAIYFILSGTLEVIGTAGEVHAEMKDGAFFGEVGILLNMRRTASIRAKTESRLFKLNKSDLDEVIKEYPTVKTTLEEAATERYQLFKLRTNTPSTTIDRNKAHVPDQFDMEVGSQSLAKLSIFRDVDRSVVNQLSMQMVRKTWKKNELIIKCGDAGNSMFFLAAGNAEVITEFGEIIDTV